MFVTFEGPEGGGKTTQIRLLAEWLRGQGCDVVTTREPGGTRIGDAVRGVLLDPQHVEMRPEAEILLFSAARAQLVGEVIRPQLERGGVVLCDRFADSTFAYQGYGRQLDLDTFAPDHGVRDRRADPRPHSLPGRAGHRRAAAQGGRRAGGVEPHGARGAGVSRTSAGGLSGTGGRGERAVVGCGCEAVGRAGAGGDSGTRPATSQASETRFGGRTGCSRY